METLSDCLKQEHLMEAVIFIGTRSTMDEVMLAVAHANSIRIR